METAIADTAGQEVPPEECALDALYHMVLAPLPFERSILRKVHLIKNMRLESAVELFSANNTGSGQISVKGFTANFGIADSDLTLLRLLESLPSFDEYSLRIGLRRSAFAAIVKFDRPAWQLNLLNSLLADFIRPIADSMLPASSEPPKFTSLLEMAQTDEAARQRLGQYADKLGSDADSIVTFLQDYADIVLSLCFYRRCLEKMMPSIDDLLKCVRDLRIVSKQRHDTLLLDTLKMVEATTNEMIADVTGRIESFDVSTRRIWVGMTREMLATLPDRLREYQAGIASIICALSVKMSRWVELFPAPRAGSPARRASFIMSEMRQGMEHIRDVLNAVPVLAEGRAA